MSSTITKILCLLVSLFLALSLTTTSNFSQKHIMSGDYISLEDNKAVYSLSDSEWDENCGTYSAHFYVSDPQDCSLAIIRSSSSKMLVQVNGQYCQRDEHLSTQRLSIVPLDFLSDNNFTETVYSSSDSTFYLSHERAAKITLKISSQRWDRSDQIYIGSKRGIINSFVINTLVFNTVAITTLVLIFLYTLSLYLAKRTETYLLPFLAYTAFILFWLLGFSSTFFSSLPRQLYDFVQVSGHFYVAYIPFAICVLMSEITIPDDFSFLFHWKGFLFVPLALGAVAYFLGFAGTMLCSLIIFFVFGSYSLITSKISNKTGLIILTLGFGFTLGLKLIAIFVDASLFPDSSLFYVLRKTRFLNIPIILSIMLFLNLRYASNFQDQEKLNQVLDRKVQERTAELERQQNLRLGMMTNIFHDLRTPLFCIKNCTEALQKDKIITEVNTEESRKELLEILHGRVEMLSRLIDELFTASKLEDGNLLMETNPVDLSKILRSVFDGLSPLAKEKEVNFTCNIVYSCKTWGDEHYLSRALDNLISNAIYYTPPTGCVRVDLCSSESCAIISIFNTGAGISEESIPHIFDRYFQSRTNTAKHRSSGLGLSIAKSLIERHHGDIAVKNIKNEGCLFTVTLPLFIT